MTWKMQFLLTYIAVVKGQVKALGQGDRGHQHNRTLPVTACSFKMRKDDLSECLSCFLILDSERYLYFLAFVKTFTSI